MTSTDMEKHCVYNLIFISCTGSSDDNIKLYIIVGASIAAVLVIIIIIFNVIHRVYIHVRHRRHRDYVALPGITTESPGDCIA